MDIARDGASITVMSSGWKSVQVTADDGRVISNASGPCPKCGAEIDTHLPGDGTTPFNVDCKKCGGKFAISIPKK